MSIQKHKTIYEGIIALHNNINDSYHKLLYRYEAEYKLNRCQKHSTHDSVFFIVQENSMGYKALKFYNNSTDFRIGSYHESLAEAYNEGVHVL